MASDFGSALREAYRVRSSEPARFLERLDELDGRQSEADEGQRQRLAYLDAFRKVVYDNATQAGIEQAEALFRNADDPDLKFRAGSLVANSLAINRNFTEALRYLNQTLPVRGSVKDGNIRDDGVNPAATLYNQLGQYQLGLSYAMAPLSGDPAPRARRTASFPRAEARFPPTIRPAVDQASAPVVGACATLGENIETAGERLGKEG